MIKPIKRDFKLMRKDRQLYNNIELYTIIKDNDKVRFNEKCNKEALLRYIKFLEISFEDIWNRCLIDDIFCKSIVMYVAKSASRQGGKDEKEQLETCNETSKKLGINIKQLTSKAIRAKKTGTIITQNQMKQLNIKKCECLKSFDAKITGKMKGYISAKITYGEGGHQDNVFEELDAMANWWKTFKNESEEYLILLIDTDLTSRVQNLNEKYEDCHNIKVFNHYKFQDYIIRNYSIERT